MRAALRAFVVAALLLFGPASGIALADIDNASGDNVQEGDNESSASQGGAANTGDAVGGQVTGIVSAGDTSVDASNRSEDADVESGEASGSNSLANFTGLNSTPGNTEIRASDIENVCGPGEGCSNLQEGDNEFTVSQTANASSGDGVGGQVIGAVTAAGGSADIVAANVSEDVDVETGEGAADNTTAAFVGLNATEGGNLEIGEGGPPGGVGGDDIENVCGPGEGCQNVQDGDNEGETSQLADGSSGDGVAGQVIGAVSAGDTSIDASNRSEDVDVETGDGSAANDATTIVGLNDVRGGNTEIRSEAEGSDIEDACGPGEGCGNLQDGDNEGTLDQVADGSSGDGVGGQIIGAVTSAGGSADIVAANESEDADVETGDGSAANSAATFVGLNVTRGGNLELRSDADASDIENVCGPGEGCGNVQEGDNELSGSQTSTASSGDGVAGQVLGAVSAGDTSIDASNSSEDVDVVTGDAAADADANVFVGLNSAAGGSTEIGGGPQGADVENSCGPGEGCKNVQEGDNSQDFDQTSVASSGDAVAGQVAGVVTSAGGSADAVLANESEDIDAETGESAFNDHLDLFVGLNVTEGGNLELGGGPQGGGDD